MGVIQSEAWDLLFDEINEPRTADSLSLGMTHFYSARFSLLGVTHFFFTRT